MKNRFKDGRHGGHLGFPEGTTLLFFDLQVTPCFLPSFKSIGLAVQKKKRKIDFKMANALVAILDF